MSRRSFGPPVAYMPGGQSQRARHKFVRDGSTVDNRLGMIGQDWRAVADTMNRMSWDSVLTHSPSTKRDLIVRAAEMPCERSEFEKALPQGYFGHAAVALWEMKADPASLRAAVESAWAGDFRSFISLAGYDLFPLLRYARFRPPFGTPEIVPVRRATRGITVDQARTGVSWTLSRGVACAWVVALSGKPYGYKGVPIVLRRTVRREDILFYTEAMEEVSFDLPPEGEVDGCLKEWIDTADQYRGSLAERRRQGIE